MPDNSLDLPNRAVTVRNFEVLKPIPRRNITLTERQLDDVIKSAGQATKDLGDIFKGLVDIAQIWANTDHEVAKLEAQTLHVQAVARTEIDRIMAHEKNIHSRAEAAHKLLVQLTEMIKLIPDEDTSSRGRLIDALSSILSGVLNETAP